jgi:tetratricopeptide (TPR) repeat protein
MIRLLVTLLIGAVLGLVGESVFTSVLPKAPASVRSAAASLGIQEKAPAPPVHYTLTGPLSGSIQAETNKKYEEAIQEVITYQQSGGDAFVASERAGWLYYLKGAYPEAERAYLNANRLHPAALNPILGLLNVAEAMKDKNAIRRAAEAVLKVDSLNYRANMVLGGSSFADHDYRGAAFAYRRVLTPYPDDVDARSGLAWAEYYSGDRQDPLLQFQTILAIYPDYPYAKQGYKLVSAINGAAAAK